MMIYFLIGFAFMAVSWASSWLAAPKTMREAPLAAHIISFVVCVALWPAAMVYALFKSIKAVKK